MHFLASAAQREIKTWLDERLRSQFPDARGTLSEVRAFVEAECGLHGYPQAISVEAGDGDEAMRFSLADPLSAVFLAAAISAAKKPVKASRGRA